MKRILYVEDEPIISYYARAFRKACQSSFHGDFQIIECSSMQEELALLQTGGFDALIQDLTLKDSTQEETQSKIPELVDLLPVYILTGDEDIMLRDRCLSLGAHGEIDFSLKTDAAKAAKTMMERIYNMIVRNAARKSSK